MTNDPAVAAPVESVIGVSGAIGAGDAPGYAAVDSDQARMQRFLLWMEENGAVFPAVRVDIDERGGRDIRAASPVAPGGLVMHIPQPMLITVATAKDSRIGKTIVQLA